MFDQGAATKRAIKSRLATLANVELIAARDCDPAELLEEIRRVLELGAPEEVKADVEHAEQTVA